MEKRNSQHDLALDELEDYLTKKSNMGERFEAKELAEAINGFRTSWNHGTVF